MRSPSLKPLVAAVCGVLLLAGCSDGSESSEPSEPSDADSAEAASPTTTSPPPPPPKKGACYRLTKQQAQQAHVDTDPVKCKYKHTAQTYYIGKLRKKLVGSADSINNTAISRTVDERCSQHFADHVGGGTDTRILARLRYVWFVPSEEDFARGARWFRCDVIGDRRQGELADLPASSQGMLDRDGALDTWGTCDRTNGGLNAESDWRMCAEPHNRRAIGVIHLGEPAKKWPGRDTLKERAGDCEPRVRKYLDDSTSSLQLTWSHPTRRQWKAGRRYGLCWTSADS